MGISLKSGGKLLELRPNFLKGFKMDLRSIVDESELKISMLKAFGGGLLARKGFGVGL